MPVHQAQRAQTRARRQVVRRRRQVATAGLLLGCTLAALLGFRLVTPGADASVAAANSSESRAAPMDSEISPTKSAPTKSAPPRSAPTLPSKASPKAPVARRSPPRATGLYARASGGTARQGSGPLKTYRVEVETGAGQSARSFAAAVDKTLAAPASWTGQGLWALQRVDGNVDFVIRLATPETVDKVCAEAGLDTRGYVSCRSGQFVMINLDRWLKAVPDYHGEVARYREYVVNHEVGHQLGYGHQGCPGPGRLAPVMQQQTFGLQGCRPNGWPYVNGKRV